MHYIDKCKHGYIVRQCRCPGGTVKIVPCPVWCKGKDNNFPYDWEEDGE